MHRALEQPAGKVPHLSNVLVDTIVHIVQEVVFGLPLELTLCLVRVGKKVSRPADIQNGKSVSSACRTKHMLMGHQECTRIIPLPSWCVHVRRLAQWLVQPQWAPPCRLNSLQAPLNARTPEGEAICLPSLAQAKLLRVIQHNVCLLAQCFGHGLGDACKWNSYDFRRVCEGAWGRGGGGGLISVCHLLLRLVQRKSHPAFVSNDN